MAQFSTADINDAKRRVEQMHRRSQNYVNSSPTPQPQDQNQAPPSTPPPSNSNSKEGGQTPFSLNSILSKLGFGGLSGSGNGDDNDSSGLILALILILSREKADNMLILALLYILL